MKVLLIVFIGSAIILSALAAMFPEVLLNPGPLMKGHHTIEKDCLSCHKPFAGVASLQCISCHKQNDISIKNVAGGFLQKKTYKALFHRGVNANSCIDCHTDHRGRDATKALKPFKHTSLSLLQQKDCTTCHNNTKPQDALHRYATGNCSECHGTNKWKPSTFNHDKLTDSTAKQCISCHKADQPKDSLHLKVSTNCATCHTATTWKPATYNHDKYFRLDRNHNVSCTTCHTDPGNYKKYTCYNCHEHSPSRIASKHIEEGISNYQNCIKCHRDASSEGGERGERGGNDD